jgi:hypothetical protein
MKKKQRTIWYEDEYFWKGVSPMLFSKGIMTAAGGEIKNVLKLTGRARAQGFSIYAAESADIRLSLPGGVLMSSALT